MIRRRDITFLIAGVFTSISFSVFSTPNVKSQVDHLTQVIRTTLREQNNVLREDEKKLFEALPDYLNCDDLGWIESCGQLNNYYKKHPTAHIRLKDSSGYSHSFAPGTPSAMISAQMNPSPQTAFNLIHQLEHEGKFVQAAHKFGAEALLANGGLKGFSQTAKQQPTVTLPTDRLTLHVLVSAKTDFDPIVKQIEILEKLHPKLNIKLHLAEGQSKYFVKDMKRKGINASVLPQKRRVSLAEKGSSFPSVWIDYRDESGKIQRNILTENFSWKSIESAAFALSRKKG